MEFVKSKDTRGINRTSKKYFLDCNTKISGNTNTREWLIIKNIILNQKVMEGLLDNNMKVVIKINTKENIDKEYNINKQLENFKGFVRYICKFSCKDDLNKYKHDDGSWNEGFCDPNGKDKTNTIVMPYYKLGNIRQYPWNKDTFDIFKKLIKNVVKILIYTNKEIGFLHNDLHLDNIMITNNCKVRIIDFELSTINEDDKSNYKKLGMDFRKLFSDIGLLLFINPYTIDNIIRFTTKMREVVVVNIDDIYCLIDKLEYR